ncbi:hypothetical protein [Oscillibacter sp.]|uniref:hypothetical protein n=1 Tax=Oscillibacter sp. TaxID=1945593 RepID=UPI0028A23626|nr:hypothetical protein [Oscillibacter sp.]
MERLTTKSILGGWTLKVPRQEGVDRLAAYEDTGLEPEEITSMRSLLQGGEYKPSPEWLRLCELAEADKDGRCVVLPCKVGDDVFSFRWSIKAQKYEICTGKIKNVRHDTNGGLVTVSDGERYCIWGKTAFPTHSAAEAALKAGEPR